MAELDLNRFIDSVFGSALVENVQQQDNIAVGSYQSDDNFSDIISNALFGGLSPEELMHDSVSGSAGSDKQSADTVKADVVTPQVNATQSAKPARVREEGEMRVYPEEAPQDIPENITAADMITLIFAEIARKGIAGHHINSMNSFYEDGINQIATKVFAVEGRIKNERDDKDPADRDISEISYKVEFTGTRLTRPSTTKYPSGKSELLTPNMARVKGQTYAIQMYIDAIITATAHYKNGGTKVITDEIRDHRIAAIPCLVGSSMCNTHLCSREMLKEWQEDPNDPGGYYIIKGGEWVPDNQENLTHNIFHCYLQKYENEVVRGTFISKAGDAFENSYQTLVRYLNNGAIIVDFTITKKLVLQMPFYIIFRALGMTSDRDIVSHIVYDVEGTDQMTTTMLSILERAFECEDSKFNPIRKSTEPPEIIEFLASKLTEVALASAKKDDNVIKYQNNNVLNMFDRYFLPHVGIEPEHRIRKLKFLGHLINKLILVHMGIVEQTDRDSYKNKRIHSAGTSMAKTFKTHYNIAFVQQIKKSITQALKTTPFSQVQLAKAIKQVTRSEALEKPLTQSITAGTGKMITHRTITVKNRVSSQTLYHKNDLNVKSTLNTINTPDANMGSKNTERADVMRRVHPTYLGYIDPSQSADTGEKVGMTKQLASTASVCGSSSSYNLKKIILRDPAIVPIDDVVMEDVSRKRYSKVFVGGDWIGCCVNSHELVYRYRQARRYGDIHQFTTIVWEPLVREVYFWTDVGRLVRPLVIVYNNIAEYNARVRAGNREATFRQWIKLTPEHLRALQRREITMEDLRTQRVVEYISPEEQESAFIALNIDTLRERAHDVRYRYTHCNVDQAIFGIVTLAAPMANHSNTVRNTLYTNHRKQSTGWFTLNYPHRIDKNVTLQHYCERPIISAFSDAITCPNGQNTIVALMLHGGLNQEDSTVANQSSIDCGMFNASHYNYEKCELEKNEKLANPDLTRTIDIKKGATYEDVKDGLIAPGTLAQKGSVLISKYAPIPNPTDMHIYSDRSIIYKHDEPVRIERSLVVRNDADVLVAKVKWRSDRPLEIGDKVSSRTGNKGICSAKVVRADMPYCEDGTVPDLLVNAHSIPTRMALNQIIECVLGQLAARKGAHIDATIFRPINIEEAIAQLAEYGITYGGHKRMWNGRTGCWIDTLIFVGPTVYQRLQKFVIDEHYATRNGPTSILTHQPLDGKSNDGGLRLGEMEAWVLCAHGAMGLLNCKFYEDSDGITIPICRVCGYRAIVNEKERKYRCKKCRDRADIVAVPSSWVANLFANEASAMNAKIQFKIAPFTYPSIDVSAGM